MSSTSLQQNFILFVENTQKDAQQHRRLCCEKCRFSTKDPELFERHVAHHREVTFSCTLCDHVSYSRVESQRHAVKHKGSFPYRCSWCPYGAVRRDYMVKHIQRIHGKSADGNFINCALPTTKTERLPQKQVKDGGLGTTRTPGGPSRDIKTIQGYSAGNLSSPVPGAGQSRPSAAYLIPKSVQQPIRNQICFTTTQSVTSTTSSPPITKTQPYIVPNTIHTISKVTQGTQGTTNPPSVLFSVGPVGEQIKRNGERTCPENSITTSALPRVNIGIPGDRSLQQKPQFQSPVVGTMRKNVVETKMIPKIHVAPPVSTNKHPQTVLSKPRDAPAAQIPVSSGVVRNIPVLQTAQRSVPARVNSNTPVESFGQDVHSVTPGVQVMSSQQKTRPSILSRAPAKKSDSSVRSGVQVKLVAPSNQPNQQNRPLMVSCPEERNQPGSSVQVELLAPLNQPIQHNKPLMVSCPEEINIPAGCLVELVEVKNVNGARELELRLVPQQLGIPTRPEGLRSAAATNATDRLSFKCRVASDADQQAKLNHGPSSSRASGVPEPSLKGFDLRNLSTDVKFSVKSEPELNLLCSSRNEANAPGPSGSRSVAYELHKIMQQQFNGDTNVMKIREPVTPHQHQGGKNTSRGVRNRNVSTQNKSSSEGFPVISSVFSLCPVPQANQSQSPTSVKVLEQQAGRTKEPLDPSPNGCLKSKDNWRFYRLDLKTEGKTGSLTDHDQRSGPSNQEKKDPSEDTRASAGAGIKDVDVKLEKSYQTFTDEQKKGTSGLCGSSDVPPREPASNLYQLNQHKKRNESFASPVLRDNLSALSMNPIVSLIRIPSLETLSLSKPTRNVPERAEGEESVTARPVLCCTSDTPNLHDRSIKLVLKRKRVETKTTDPAQDSQLDFLYVDFLPACKKMKKAKKRSKKRRWSREQQQLSRETDLVLTPVKQDQPVKRPGPDQPVVVLNHPNPRVRSDLSYQNCFSSADQNITTSFQTVEPVPSFKMKLKKVQGRKYQVTELLLKGVSERTTLERGSGPAL